MQNKFIWEKGEVQPVKMKDLICKDCRHRSPKAAICAAYMDGKPAKVIDDEECEFYVKEQD